MPWHWFGTGFMPLELRRTASITANLQLKGSLPIFPIRGHNSNHRFGGGVQPSTR